MIASGLPHPTPLLFLCNSDAYQNRCWGLLLERLGIEAPPLPTAPDLRWVFEQAACLPERARDDEDEDKAFDAQFGKFRGFEVDVDVH
jgi:hypothetical protein